MEYGHTDYGLDWGLVASVAMWACALAIVLASAREYRCAIYGTFIFIVSVIVG